MLVRLNCVVLSIAPTTISAHSLCQYCVWFEGTERHWLAEFLLAVMEVIQLSMLTAGTSYVTLVDRLQCA